MRIVGGEFSGRVIAAPKGRDTRPTSDRVREAMFNILAHHDWGRDALEGAIVLDIFAGTGALALEALSRGAAKAWLIEYESEACKIAAANIRKLGAQDRCVLLQQDALDPPKAKTKATLVFLDPPYRQNLVAPTLTLWHRAKWIAPGAIVVIETARTEQPDPPADFAHVMSRTYGDTAVHFFTYK